MVAVSRGNSRTAEVTVCSNDRMYAGPTGDIWPLSPALVWRHMTESPWDNVLSASHTADMSVDLPHSAR